MWSIASSLCLLILYWNRYALSQSNQFYEDRQLFEGSTCQLKNGGKGVCARSIDCPDRIEQILSGDPGSDDRCGFDHFYEIYCCASNVFGRSNPEIRPAEAACGNYKRIVKGMVADGRTPPVINGVLAAPGEFPHMVALGYLVSDEEAAKGVKQTCGGTLISDRHVLTAAHCVSNTHGLIPHEVLLGAENLEDKESEKVQRIPISKIIRHPNYKRGLSYHDLAILELERPVKLTVDVHPTCLMTEPLDPKETAFTPLLVLGWGSADVDGNTSTKLMKADHLKFVSKKRCSRTYASLRDNIPNGLDDAMICVRDPDATRRSDSCWGDSGGPLLISSGQLPRLMGITSFGQACGGSTPGVYVAVYRYLDWIEEQIWPNFN